MGGPSAPAIVNLTCHSQDSITIRWKRPYEFYNTIDFYVIKTRLAGQDTHRDIRINASAKELETAVSWKIRSRQFLQKAYFIVEQFNAEWSYVHPVKIL